MRRVMLFDTAARGVALAILVLAPGCHENVEITSSGTPQCSDATWDRVVAECSGVTGETPQFLNLGTGNAERGGGWYDHDDVWYPVTGRKQSVCGTLQGIRWNEDDDFDWNLDVHIDSNSRLISDFTSKFNSANWGDNGPRIHAEVAPEKSFPNRAQFWMQQLQQMDSGKIGVFGPWVGDKNPSHDDETPIPEIHPAELLWWRQTGSNPTIYRLLLMQDSVFQYDEAPSGRRNRFRVRDYFDFDGAPEPAGWRPWAEGPIWGRFRIAFEATSGPPPAEFIIALLENRTVLAADVDMDDGQRHGLIYDGAPILSVVEVADKEIGVQVSDLCRTVDGKVRGFLDLYVLAGSEAPDEGGYASIVVVRLNGAP